MPLRSDSQLAVAVAVLFIFAAAVALYRKQALSRSAFLAVGGIVLALGGWLVYSLG